MQIDNTADVYPAASLASAKERRTLFACPAFVVRVAVPRVAKALVLRR